MLIWIAALHCEAKPIIDFYRLRKSSDHHVFDLYQNDQMLLVISGIGKIAAAAATAWIAALNQNQASLGWINIGIAGAAKHAIGTAFWLNKIGQPDSQRYYYSVPAFTIDFQQTTCISLNEASFEYRQESIYDMEASAFFATATRFSSAELVHCLKIISDNQLQKTGYDKAAISALIHRQINGIDDFAQKLQRLNQQLIAREVNPDDWRFILGLANFSQTQQAQLRTRLSFLSNQHVGKDELRGQIKALDSSRKILLRLDQLCHELSRNL